MKAPLRSPIMSFPILPILLAMVLVGYQKLVEKVRELRK